MAAHRYWRVNCLTNQTSYNGYQQLAEIVMAASVGGPSLFGTGTAAASSSAGTNTADQACDGDPSTFWSSTGGNPQAWGYDFGVSVLEAVVEVRLTSRNSTIGDMANAPSTFTLDYSDDGSAWTASPTFTPAAWTVGQTQAFDVTPAVVTTADHGSASQASIEAAGRDAAAAARFGQASFDVIGNAPSESGGGGSTTPGEAHASAARLDVAGALPTVAGRVAQASLQAVGRNAQAAGRVSGASIELVGKPIYLNRSYVLFG